MQKPSDERLIAFLDGEVEESERAEIAMLLADDASLREQAFRLTESAALLRASLDDVLHEPLPERLLAAARGQSRAAGGDKTGDAASSDENNEIVSLSAARTKRAPARRTWWIGAAAAAALVGIVTGTGIGWFAGSEQGAKVAADQQATINLASGNWLDSIAGYHKLFVAAGPNDVALADVPPSDGGDGVRKVAQKLPADFRLPNLKPWGLAFQGARFIIVEGRPATQLFYTTDNKTLGPLTVVVGASSKPDLAPTFDHRDDVNLLYWRHHGHAYALVGTADIGYLWNIANDIAYQLDAI